MTINYTNSFVIFYIILSMFWFMFILMFSQILIIYHKLKWVVFKQETNLSSQYSNWLSSFYVFFRFFLIHYLFISPFFFVLIMGNKHSKGEITQSELLELQKKTYCMLLRFHPYPFHSSVWRGSQVLVWKVQEDQLLQRRWWTHWLWVFRTCLFCSHPTTREFRTALGIRGGYFYEQFYELFDKSKDGLINFDEFASAIAMMSNKMPQKDKLKCTWFESLSFLDLFHF